MIPPARHVPGPRGPDAPGGIPYAVLGVLAREAAFGLSLWSGAAPDIRIRLAVTLTGLCGIILWTRWFGLLRPRGWAKACWEGLLLYIGAICMGNLLWLAFGVAPWWR